MRFADQMVLFPEDAAPGCLRFDIGTCSGPCVGECSRNSYSSQIRATKAFLDGKDERPLSKLQGLMAEAAAALEFERAAAMRDRFNDLDWLRERLAWLRQARHENTFVYPVVGADQRTIWYFIHRGRVIAASYQPTTKTNARTTLALLQETYKDLNAPPVPAGQVDHVLLVAAWFRKYPNEKASLMTPPQAQNRCTTLLEGN
jgi:excinuclease ABC subunit C